MTMDTEQFLLEHNGEKSALQVLGKKVELEADMTIVDMVMKLWDVDKELAVRAYNRRFNPEEEK